MVFLVVLVDAAMAITLPRRIGSRTAAVSLILQEVLPVQLTRTLIVAPDVLTCLTVARPGVVQVNRGDPEVGMSPLNDVQRHSFAGHLNSMSVTEPTVVPTSAQASAPPCSRDRDGSRGRAACRYPAPARTCQPRDHVDLLAGDRQLGDHRDGPRPTGTRDLGNSWPEAES